VNETVEHERFPIPTVEETLIEMIGSKVFFLLLVRGDHSASPDRETNDAVASKSCLLP
jgi:hypothetical protein